MKSEGSTLEDSIDKLAGILEQSATAAGHLENPCDGCLGAGELDDIERRLQALYCDLMAISAYGRAVVYVRYLMLDILAAVGIQDKEAGFRVFGFEEGEE